MSTEQNKAAIRRIIQDAWNDGNYDVFDELYAPDYVSHALPAGVPRGIEGIIQFLSAFRAAFPDVTLMETPFGTGIRVTIRTDDLARTVSQMAGSDHLVDRWFGSWLRELAGFHLGETVPPGGAEFLFEWTAERQYEPAIYVP